jgi:hypothetical protein
VAGKADFDAVVARLNDATNVLAAKIAADAAKLRDALTNAGALGPEEDAALTSLGETAARLEGLGADSTNPVPDA